AWDQDVPATHGAAVLERLPCRLLACESSGSGSRVFPGGPVASRRGYHPAAVSAGALRRDRELRIEGSGAGGRVPLHGRAEDGRARDLARRRAHDDAVSGDEFSPRNFSQASRAHGYPRESRAVVGRDRSGRGYYWGFAAGAVRSAIKDHNSNIGTHFLNPCLF